MSYSASTLLTRNLPDVFGENDPERRCAGHRRIFTEDCVFYKPKGELFLLKVMSAVPTKVSPRLQRRGDQDLLQRSRRVSSTMR